MKISTLIASSALLLTLAVPAHAGSHEGKMNNDMHKGHDMSQMGGVGTKSEVPVKAVIHKVDADKLMMNVTHDPIPDLKWPKMTMDLKFTKRVDLSSIKPGMKAIITLKQGRDKQYRITGVKPAK